MRSGRAGWWVAVAGVAIAVALPFVAALGWDDYSHRSQYISELGADGAPNGAAVSATFFVIGVLFVAWAALTARRLGAAGLTGATGAAVAAVAVWLAGGGLGLTYAVPAVARCEPGCPDEDIGTAQMIHNLTGSAGYTLAIAALVVFGLTVRRSGSGTKERARQVGRAGLIAAPVLAAIGLATLVGDDWRGLLQRLLELGLYAWVLAVAWLAQEPAQQEDDAVRT